VDVFATRTLSYTDDDGKEKEVVLTVFRPAEVEDGDWRCRFAFDPRFSRVDIKPSGADFLQAFVGCLVIALSFFKTSDPGRRAHWRGMFDCGLPEFSDDPVSWGSVEPPEPEDSARDMDVLAIRRLGCPDESGITRELLLTVFVPFKEGEIWKCGITFGPPLSTGVYYGTGEDLIEALLDALALARAVYERNVPGDWDSNELYSCRDFPYKVGRSFRKDPAAEIPGMPDRSAG
jgi:hypothetical protein